MAAPGRAAATRRLPARWVRLPSQSRTCQLAGQEAGLCTATRVQEKGDTGNTGQYQLCCELRKAKAVFLQFDTTARILAVFPKQK